MDEINYEIYGRCVVGLIKSALTDTAPERLPEEIEPAKLFGFCVMHKVESMVYLALSRMKDFDADILAEFERRYMINLNIYSKQQYYLEVVKKAFEAAKIQYIVLKGWAMIDMYPHPECRQAADVDIYIGAHQREKAMSVMKELGFEGEYSSDYGHHDEYHIGKMVHIELHHVMIKNVYPWTEECNRLPKRAVAVSGVEYEFTKEDYYFFMIAHIAKHLKANGIGIKSITDVYVYLNKAGADMSEKVLADTLAAGRLTDFDKVLRELIGVWFYDGEHTEGSRVLEHFLFMSGWMGSKKQQDSTKVANAVHTEDGTSKIRMYAANIFPSFEYMKEKYSVLTKLPVLLPVYYIVRIFSIVIFKRKSLERFNNIVQNGDVDEGRRLNSMRQKFGL